LFFCSLFFVFCFVLSADEARRLLCPFAKYMYLKCDTSSQVPGAYTCNPTYLGGWDWEDCEDCGLRPAQGNTLWDSISKITRAKWIGTETQVVEHLLCRCEALSSNCSSTQKINSRLH
jgi:hypothetical protein